MPSIHQLMNTHNVCPGRTSCRWRIKQSAPRRRMTRRHGCSRMIPPGIRIWHNGQYRPQQLKARLVTLFLQHERLLQLSVKAVLMHVKVLADIALSYAHAVPSRKGTRCSIPPLTSEGTGSRHPRQSRKRQIACCGLNRVNRGLVMMAMLFRCTQASPAPHPVRQAHSTQTQRSANQVKIVKRSYKRACARALRSGYATYRGRIIHSDEVPSTLRSSSLAADALRQTNRKGPTNAGSRLEFMHWSADGLPYHEFMRWPESKNECIPVVIVSETRMAETCEWQTAKYNCMHTGGKHARVLLLVARSFCSSEAITWGELLREGFYTPKFTPKPPF